MAFLPQTVNLVTSTGDNSSAAATSSSILTTANPLFCASGIWLFIALTITCSCAVEAFYLDDLQQQPRVLPISTALRAGQESGHPANATTMRQLLRQKAKTFGQSAEEIKKVNYYMRKMQLFQAKQHPEEEEAQQNHLAEKPSGAFQTI
ncbi:unnamed protein product [Gongylonema pulchrum]|uniref:Uncharacterized protein n=1 Tax=Gongylonema pulchrum TaxID=637853 RepID=A0A183D8Y4_9BILA|nr:unnamed protein product [Gongylonema pulchrum]